MTIVRAGAFIVLAGACLAVAPASGVAQTSAVADKPLAFEVASVRENKTDGDSSSNFELDGNGNVYWVMCEGDKTDPEGSLFRATNQTLMRYIIFAYKLNGTEELALRVHQCPQCAPWAGLGLDMPGWVANKHYDIEARAPYGATKDQMRLMVQSLLAKRFKLVVHKETRQVPVFAIRLEKPGTLGPQLRPHPASDTCATTEFPDAKGPQKSAANADRNRALPIPCGMIARLPPSVPGRHRIGGRKVTLVMAAESLPAQTGLVVFPRPVIDGTGLSGSFDFSLEWTEDMTGDTVVGPNAPGETSGPSIAQALRQQLGLKLVSTKGPVELLVIDHVERPTEN